MAIFKALTSGLLVGVIFQEAIIAGLSILLPTAWIHAGIVTGWATAPPWPLWPAPALAWGIGGLAGGAMATALSSRRACGVAVGLALALPAALIVGLVTPGNPMLLLAAAVPAVGAAAGAALAARLRHEDLSVTINGQSV